MDIFQSLKYNTSNNNILQLKEDSFRLIASFGRRSAYIKIFEYKNIHNKKCL